MIFETFAKEKSKLFWFNERLLYGNANKKSYWNITVFDVFLTDWEFFISNLPPFYSLENKMEILKQSSECYEFRVHNCMFMEAFSLLGMPELTRIMCAVDNAVFNVYLPEQIVFHRNGVGNRIVDGAPFCSFVCEGRD